MKANEKEKHAKSSLKPREREAESKLCGEAMGELNSDAEGRIDPQGRYCPFLNKPRELSISEMAEINHVTPETLRHYDRIGLLKPAARDPKTGYRSYLLSQSAQLDMIQFLKELGFELSFIAEQFSEPDLPRLIKLFRELDGSIEKEIHALKQRRRILRRTIENYERYICAPPDGSIILEYLPERHVYVVDTEVNFYDYDRDVYEGLLRRVKEGVQKERLPNISFCNVGTIWRREHLEKHHFHSTELFIFIEPEDAGRVESETLPSGLYLCLYCDSFEREPLCAEKLLAEIERLDYRISGDYICEVLSDLPILSSHERSMYIRIQVPVTPL